MKQDGVQFVFNSKVQKAELRNKTKVIQYETNGTIQDIVVDEILVGVGRAPNVENLGLEGLGVEKAGPFIKIDKTLRTNVAGLYAIGDVAGPMIECPVLRR